MHHLRCVVCARKKFHWFYDSLYLYIEQYKRKSYVLAFREIVGKQTYEALAKIIADVFEEYSIPISKITHVVTDGGSAFCKAFRVFGRRTDESLMNYDEEAINFEENEEVNLRTTYMHDQGEFYYSNELHLNTINVDNLIVNEYESKVLSDELNEESYIEDEVEVNEEFSERIELPPQHRCVSHLLNLISDDFEKELTGASKTVLISSISKLHALWVLIGRSGAAKRISVEMLGCTLQTPCVTRWNSKFDAIKSSLKVKLKINPLILRLKTELTSAQKNLNTLTSNDFNVIEEYLKITSPVACALDKLQGEINGSQGFIIPTLMSMKHRISAVTCRQTEFKRAMLKAIDKRFGNMLRIAEENRELILATTSLPRFKESSFESEESQRIAMEFLINECQRLSIETSDIEIEDAAPTSNDACDDFYVCFNARNTHRNSTDDRIEAEVFQYFNDTRKNDEMLDNYPFVREVYYKHNTTLSASAVVERVFSQSILIFTPRRNRISSENFEKTLLLKYNRELIETKQIFIDRKIVCFIFFFLFLSSYYLKLSSKKIR